MRDLKATSGSTVTVCFPALNEAGTIGAAASVAVELRDRGLVDQVIVVDSGSEDDTVAAARSTGADVYSAGDILHEVFDPNARGKGETMWKSLAVAKGDVVAWIDADISGLTPSFITRLIAPLLAGQGAVMSKAFYERPLQTRAGHSEDEGARVTEIAARPLLGMFFPGLQGVIQPLSGEYAIRREAALDLPFVTGYAVDVALLIDVVGRWGPDSVTQVDLGRRVHRNRSVRELGRTSHQVIRAILQRADEAGSLKLADVLPEELVQFIGDRPSAFSLPLVERPPLRSLGIV